jgi:segregation and condensation protein A
VLETVGEDYQVKTDVFEGPLSLLLHLIEKRKLHINDVSLVTVTDDFIAYVNNQNNLPISQSANFIWVASTLLLIKSRSLIPALTLTEEEEEGVETLETRLRLYQYFKRLVPGIARQFGKQMLYAPLASKRTTDEPVFSPDKTCSVPYLFASITAVLQTLPETRRVPRAVVEKVVSLEEMIERLSSRIQNSLSLSFNEFSHKDKQRGSLDREEKVALIIGFLAMLELVKRGVLNVKQDMHFGDIIMETEEISTPRYL